MCGSYNLSEKPQIAIASRGGRAFSGAGKKNGNPNETLTRNVAAIGNQTVEGPKREPSAKMKIIRTIAETITSNPKKPPVRVEKSS